MHIKSASVSSISLRFFMCERCFSMDYLLLVATAFLKEFSSFLFDSWL
jgi:hypothetical protein